MYRAVPYKDDAEQYADDVLSFFIHCFHIGDWISARNTVGMTKQKIDDFIHRNRELEICGDLCNGSKHCKLTRRWTKKWTTRKPCLASKQFISSGTNDQILTTQCKFEILVDDNKFQDAVSYTHLTLPTILRV